MDGQDDDHLTQDQLNSSGSNTELQDAPMTSTTPYSDDVSTGAMLDSNPQEDEEEGTAEIVQNLMSTESPSGTCAFIILEAGRQMVWECFCFSAVFDSFCCYCRCGDSKAESVESV